MATGNFLIDTGLQEQVSTQAGFTGEAPYLQEVQNITQEPSVSEEQPEFEIWGLQSQEELDLMKYVKETGGTAEDFTEVLEDFRGKTRPELPEQVQVQGEEQIDSIEEPDVSGLDIGVKSGEVISDIAKKFKFDSGVDDGIIKSGLKFIGNLPGNTAQLAGDLIQVASDPVGTVTSINNLAKSGIETALNKAFLAEGEEFFTSKEVEQVADVVGGELSKLGEPGRIKELLVENPADVLLSITGGLGIAKNVAKSKNLTSLASKLEKAEKFTNPIKLQAETLKGTNILPGKVKKSIFPDGDIDKIVGQIIQGKPGDVPKAKKALSRIDTKGVKTYKELNENIGEKISSIAKKQDDLLPKEEILKIDELTSRVGKRETNFIKNAIDDLENVGTKETDLELLNKVDELRGKESLSIKDINDLARFYGSEFKSKSFNAAGDPKSSVSATRFENVRKGLKEKSRELLPDNTVKILDEELSELFNTKALIEKMGDKANKLAQKVQQRGLVEGVGRNVGRSIDLFTLGGARSFFNSFLGSNVGNKSFNNLTLQERLGGNLKKLDKLLNESDKISDKGFVSKASDIIKDITTGGIEKGGIPAQAITEIEQKKEEQ